jgi:hypothetical protein
MIDPDNYFETFNLILEDYVKYTVLEWVTEPSNDSAIAYKSQVNLPMPEEY